MRYDKLVRDNIPDIIRKSGREPAVRTASSEEYLKKLESKLEEEIREFIENPSEEEMADILEVLTALANAHGLSWEAIEEKKKIKREERGGFEKRL